MKANGFEITVLPKGRGAADEYPHRGETWIEGRYNSWYEIQLHNHTSERVMVVLTVDGVGVIDGELGSFSSPGFILQPYQKLDVPGWVRNNQEAARFVFSRLDKSYAEQTGQGGNQGVIGTAWFREQVYYKPQVPQVHHVTKTAPLRGGTLAPNWYLNTSQQLSQNSVQTDSYTSVVGASSVGTGWGESTQFPTIRAEFEKRGEQPDQILCLRYDSAQALQRMGIRLRDRTSSTYNQAFPGNSEGYCKPPPTWAQKKNFG